MRRRSHFFRATLNDVLRREPFEPFRVKLVNGDHHDIFHPQNVFMTHTVVNVHTPDQHWVIFPINKIASLESLLADFQAEYAAHAAQDE